MELVRDLWADGLSGKLLLALMLALIALVVLLISIAIYGAFSEAEQWEAFAAEHDCKRVGHMKGSTQTGVGVGMTSGGQMGTIITTSTTPNRTGWLCNDGVTYWR